MATHALGTGERRHAQPHYHVTLGGRVVRTPMLHYAHTGLVLCDLRVVFTTGVGDVGPMRFSVVVMGADAKTCRRSLTAGTRVELAGDLVHSDVCGPGGPVGCYYSSVGTLAFAPGPPTSASPGDDAASVRQSMLAVATEIPDEDATLTLKDLGSMVRRTIAQLDDAIGPDLGGLRLPV